MKNNLILQAFRIRPFFLLIASEFFSQFSMNLFNFILLIVVFAIAKSNFAVSGVVIAFTLPAILFGIWAGVLVDRWNKKNVLFMSNILRGLLLLPLIFLQGDLLSIYLITFSVSLITQFFIPAETPIIPVLVGRKLLLSANAIFGMTMYASIFLAYALSGPILYLFGKTNVFIFTSLLFFIAAFFASAIRYKTKIISTTDTPVVLGFTDEIKTVVRLLSKTKTLYHALFALTLSQVLIYVMATIGPGYAERVLMIEVENFPILFITPAVIGIALGALIIGSFLHKFDKSSLTKAGLTLLGISILLMPFGDKFEARQIVQFINMYLPHVLKINAIHVMVTLAFVIGFATAFIFVPANTTLQEESTDESRGKIYGVLNTMIGLLAFAPVLLVGVIADSIGVRSVIVGIGGIVLLIAFIRIFITDKK